MISYCTKVHLAKCNGSWVVSTKQNMNFNILMFVFFVFDKNGLIKSCSSFEDQYTKFHGLMLTGASFVSTSEVWMSAILECLNVQD
jgi:hypothetical protein